MGICCEIHFDFASKGRASFLRIKFKSSQWPLRNTRVQEPLKFFFSFLSFSSETFWGGGSSESCRFHFSDVVHTQTLFVQTRQSKSLADDLDIFSVDVFLKCRVCFITECPLSSPLLLVIENENRLREVSRSRFLDLTHSIILLG